MITLALINFIISVSSQVINFFLSPVHDLVANLSTKITALQIPLIFYDTINLAVLFLPTGTIFILLGITSALICISLVLSVARFLLHGFGII